MRSICQRCARAGCAFLLILFLAGFAAGSVSAQEPPKLSPCTCADLQRLKDRLQKLEGIEKLVSRKLQETASGAQASQADWDKLQAEINSYLRALQLQNLTAFPDTSLFPSPDPWCSQESAANACSEQEFAAHQGVHAASCSASRWTWQSPWPASTMLQEESAALHAEIDALQQIIDSLHCGPCPQFMVTVQLETKIFQSGAAVVASSDRTLNNGQGIQVPLAMQSDGSFQGTGMGVDAGRAAGGGPSERVSGDFGHFQSVYARGTIESGICTSSPCAGDIMHLTLIGGSSTQITQMQARGAVNRDINQATPTGAATLSFDLPAYVGGQAHRTLLANGTVTSVMQVTLSQAANGAAPLPAGGSMLLSAKECRSVAQAR
ncbi:MAG TPA: hypothetical protein VGJ21_25425 [Terracidiphilus sp.]|jgi:hypothetical protein